jgi:hypothetical protein
VVGYLSGKIEERRMYWGYYGMKDMRRLAAFKSTNKLMMRMRWV